MRVIRTDEEVDDRQGRPAPAAGLVRPRDRITTCMTSEVQNQETPDASRRCRPTCLRKMDAYWRAANYLSVGQIYLLDNPLLREPLKLEHIKPRLLGHWGTTPGLNFVYVHLNRVIKEHDLDMIYISGPGHGGPALVANTYLEGTYSEVYPNITQDERGMKRLFKQFSFPGRHPQPRRAGDARLDPRGRRARLQPRPRLRRGVRQPRPDRRLRRRRRRGRDRPAGHELALATSSSTPPPTAPCCRSCTSTATRSPTRRCSPGSATTSWSSSCAGYGYTPYFVEGDEPEAMHQLMAATLDTVVAEIRRIQADARRARLRPSGRAGR